MPSLAIFPFDVDDVMDFDVLFGKFLRIKKDRPAEVNPLTLLQQPDGITLLQLEMVDDSFAKLWVSEPVGLGDYKFKFRLNTHGGRRKSVEITIRVQ